MKSFFEGIEAFGQFLSALGSVLIWGFLFCLIAPIAWALLMAIVKG
jgi:hypothetical protein